MNVRQLDSEAIRQITKRMTEIPQAQWNHEDRATFKHYLEHVFDPENPATWGLRADEIKGLNEFAKLDLEKTETWPDRVKANRFEKLMTIIDEPADDPWTLKTFLEPMTRFEEQGKEDSEEYEELNRRLEKHTAAAEKEAEIIFDEMDELCATRHAALEELGFLYEGRLAYRMERLADLGNIFSDSRNSEMLSLLEMLHEAEKTPREAWSPELCDSVTDFCRNYEDLGGFLLGVDIYNHIEINARGDLDLENFYTWMDCAHTESYGYEVFKLERNILLAQNESEKTLLREELEEIYKNVEPFIDEIRHGLNEICEAEENRVAKLEEKLNSLGRTEPEVGQRVTFQAHSSNVKLTGNIVATDEKTVTMQCGRKEIHVLREKGNFHEVSHVEKNVQKEKKPEREGR